MAILPSKTYCHFKMILGDKPQMVPHNRKSIEVTSEVDQYVLYLLSRDKVVIKPVRRQRLLAECTMAFNTSFQGNVHRPINMSECSIDF